MAKSYNRYRAPAPFKVGDIVYYRNHPVSHAGCNVTVRLVDPTTSKLVTRTHVSLFKSGLPARP